MKIGTKLQLENRRPHVEVVETPHVEELDKKFQTIAQRAFAFFQQRGSADGHALDDWLAAEAELFRKAPCELAEKGNEIMVRLEVPGFNERDLDVKVEAERIYVTGHKEEIVSSDTGDRVVDERDYRDIFRIVALPAPVIADHATANLHEGVLTIFVPKRAEVRTKQAVA